jgi:hypothetical protein
MHATQPPPVLFHSVPPVRMPQALTGASHVYVRVYRHRTPLQRPYDGPFRVLEAGSKAFIIDRNGKRNTVSVDRLKAAYLPTPVAVPAVPLPLHAPTRYPAPQPSASPQPAPTTRSGRPIRLPTRYRT